MKIRKEQMDTFSEASMRSFEDRAVEYLKQKYPDEYQRRGETGMRALIQKTTKRTKAYELDTEAGVVVCAELSIVQGDRFYTRTSWARPILYDSELHAEEKVERLQDYLASKQPPPSDGG